LAAGSTLILLAVTGTTASWPLSIAGCVLMAAAIAIAIGAAAYVRL
jgi:hypothetical protein